jgi:rRNA-processing protein FCF1
MTEIVNLDTCALVDHITVITARLKHLTHFTLHKSVAREIVALSDDLCPEKQEVGLQAALALTRLQALPHVTVTCDPREPSTVITDDDLLFWSEHDQVPLLTGDVALQERASRRGIQVLRTQHLEQDLRPLLPELLAVGAREHRASYLRTMPVAAHAWCECREAPT